jgi:hypothetical protein
MKFHLDLNDETALTKLHFDVWLKHFNNAVDELFDGNNYNADQNTQERKSLKTGIKKAPNKIRSFNQFRNLLSRRSLLSATVTHSCFQLLQLIILFFL